MGGENLIKAVATTKFQEGGFPILTGNCYMHKQASFYSTIWPEGTKVGPDGDVDTFYLPVKAGDPKYMLGGGDLIAAGTDKPETFDCWPTPTRVSTRPPSSPMARPACRPARTSTPQTSPTRSSRGFAEMLKGSDVFRFDGADMMPAAIGSGAFWKEATAWIAGGSTDDMLNNIEAAWKALPPS